jgi:hypothetical protein
LATKPTRATQAAKKAAPKSVEALKKISDSLWDIDSKIRGKYGPYSPEYTKHLKKRTAAYRKLEEAKKAAKAAKKPAPKKPAPKKGKPKTAAKPKGGTAPKPKKIPRSRGRLERGIRTVGRVLLHGKNAARILSGVLKGGGAGMTEAAIQYALEKRYKEGIASGRIKKPTLRQIREARKKAEAEAARKKKIKPGGETVTKTKRKKYVAKYYKMKPMTIKARKKYEIIGGEPMKKPKKKKKK